MKTLKQLAQNALDIQDASNLSGVIHSFSSDIRDLRDILESTMGNKFSTTAVNQHPVCVLYSSKIASLTGSETGFSFSDAYGWAKRITNG